MFLKLFADYAVANGVSADDGLRLAAEYGGGKEEMLTAFYEQYWLHLREESEKGGDDDSLPIRLTHSPTTCRVLPFP